MADHDNRLCLPAEEPVPYPVHSSKKTFLDLPPEIRDEIYYHGLRASLKVIPYRTKGDVWPEDWEEPPDLVIKPQLAALATGLFWSNRQVAREARRVFYSYNTFERPHAQPGQNWTKLRDFLSEIGDTNRGHIRTLVVYPTHSDYAYEASDGTLYREVADFENGICHKVPVPGARPPPDVVSPPPRWPGRWHDTRVEVLEPATRACFRLLGAKGPKVTMVLKIARLYFPACCYERTKNSRRRGRIHIGRMGGTA